VERAASTRTPRIAVIGAGPGGLCTAIRLRQEGFDDVVVLEQAAGVGGTWWHNRYPGAACDIQSHLYSFSFELKRDWTRPYATQPEIQRYFEHCVERYGLGPHLRLGCAVRSARWDDAAAVWRLTTADGDEVTADVVVSAVGMFNALHWPDIPGLDTFAGPVFHSARWDHGQDLTGRRVGVIGCAASAIQFVPEIAPLVAQLDVYQRTANWVLPKEDVPFTDDELAAFATDPDAAPARRQEIWSNVDKVITFSDPALLARAEEAGRRAISVVRDPEVRRKLTPTEPYGCKRPLISNVYYETYNRPNVELVTEDVDHVTADAVVTVDGVVRPADTLVVATGFETTRYLSTIEVIGRDGRRLDDAWSAGAEAYLGITTSGFPNLFMLYGPNTNNGSIIYMLECQVEYVLRQVRRLADEDLAWLDVRPDVMRAYNEALQHDLDGVAVWQAGCPGYYRVASGRIVTQWPHTMAEYRRRTSTPDPEAYELGRLPAAASATSTPGPAAAPIVAG
jgi:cation diffusion facilitator CzcD-associated flavoprotein CzcO